MKLKDLWFWRNYTTVQHEQWWKKRTRDWKAEYETYKHPHRFVICYFLRMLEPWRALIEVGSGAGPNLGLIKASFKGKQLCGMDVNEEALSWGKKNVGGVEYRIGSATDIFASDKSADVMLTDMCLIYVGPRNIKKALEEIKRVSIQYVLFCEFHHPSWWKRWKLRIRNGYHAYDYKKLLTKMNFYDVETFKINEKHWPDADATQREFATIIIAKVPRK